MTDSGEESCGEIRRQEEFQSYVSCIRIFGKPILPPLMTAERRDEMRRFKGLAEQVEVKLHNKRCLSQNSSSSRSTVEEIAPEMTPSVPMEPRVAMEPCHPIDTASKCVDTQEILEEFDPLSCSGENSRTRCRQSVSTDEFSKTGSSDDSVALTNSTDLYHYMDITGSSLGDGRSTRRSLTPIPGEAWTASPNKASGEQEILATYEGLNQYLDSILISSASLPPSRAKCSDEEATPTNGHLCQSIQFLCLDEDKRPKSCPLSPIPYEPIPNPVSTCETSSEKLVEIAESLDKPALETGKPRLVRSNSYTLDTPSPMLLAHLEAEKKKSDSKKMEAKDKAVPSKNRASVIVKRNAGTKRNDSHLCASRITHSPPKKAKNPTPAVVSPANSAAKTQNEVIVQPEVRKLFAELQAEHNRQMEELLRRQRKEQEMIREAILGHKIPTEGAHTWAQYLQANGAAVEAAVAKQDERPSAPDPVVGLSHPRKCLSSSFILSQVASKVDDRAMSLSAPPGSLVATVASPKRPSSSPALTTPIPALTNPIPALTNPIPALTKPIPALTNPIPALTNPIPALTNPIPALTNPVPDITTPVLDLTTPIPVLTIPKPVSPAARDTNGNLTNDHVMIPRQDTAFISQLLALSRPESLSDNERVSMNEASPRAKRRVWTNRQAEANDPDWLQLSRQRQMHWAASKIQAGVRGYLTRRLLRTERVQGCITVIHDTILCALELQKECTGNIEPSDLQLHGRLIHQLSDACREIHGIFVELPVAKRMAIIAVDRERLLNRSPRSSGPRPLSRATQIALTRKMAQNNSNVARSVVSTTRRKNWNNIKEKVSTQDSCEIVPSCLSRSSTASNGDTQRTVSGGGGGGSRKPWR